MIAWLGFLLCAVGMPAGLALLGWLATRWRPVVSQPGAMSESRARSILVSALVAWLGLSVLAAWQWWRVLCWVGDGIRRAHPDAFMTLTVGGVEWALIAALLGSVVAAVLVEVALRFALGERYRRWARTIGGDEEDDDDASDPHQGAAGVFAVVGGVAGLLAGVLLLAFADWYVIVTEEAIHYDPFWSPFERRIAYDEVSEIHRLDHIKDRWRGWIVLRVATVDGTEWVSHPHPGRLSNADVSAIARFADGRSPAVYDGRDPSGGGFDDVYAELESLLSGGGDAPASRR